MTKFTKIFIWVMMTIIIGVDIYLAANKSPGDTISEITLAYSFRWVTIPLMHGILTGHLFWPVRGTLEHRWIRLAGLIAVVLVSIVGDICDWFNIVPIIPDILGIGLGHIGWPQTVPKGTPLLQKR